MADYVSQFTGAEIDSRLRKAGTAVQPAALESKQDTLVSGENIKTINGQSVVGSGNIQIQAGDTDAVKYVEQTLTDAQKTQARTNIGAAAASALSALETAIAAKYSKPSGGIPETDLASGVQSALALARTSIQSLADYYSKTEVDALLDAVGSEQYVDVTTLPTASASTLGKIYLVGPDANGFYDRYYTSYDGSTYSWVAAGNTEINLANYATKAELSQLQHKVDKIVIHHTETINKTGDLAVASGGQTLNFYDINIRPGRKYTITVESDTDNTGYIRIGGYDITNTQVLFHTGNINQNINANPYTLKYNPAENFGRFFVLIRGIAVVGTLTLTVVEEWDEVLKQNDLDILYEKPGKNRANPSGIIAPRIISVDNGYAYVTTRNAGGKYITGYIPIKNGQTLTCNQSSGSNTNNRVALFKEKGDIMAIYGTDVLVNTDVTRTITNNLGYDAYAVFLLSETPEDVQVEQGVAPTAYEPYSAIAGYIPSSEIDMSPYGVIGINYPEEVEKVVLSIANNHKDAHKLHFIHISDNHGSNFGDADSFTDPSPASFLVNTGDLVTDKFSDSYDTTKGLILAMTKPGYVTLGNHDCNNSTSLQARFEKFIEPLNTHNGLTGNTKTYYSVDFATEQVKCIFLDMNDGYGDTTGLSVSRLIAGKMSSEQINWFATELQSAKTNGYDVAVFIHVSPDYVDTDRMENSFYDGQVAKATGVAFICDMVDGFINGGTVSFTADEVEYSFTFVAGGKFAGWFCGHTHHDCYGWLKDHPKQFSCSVARPNRNTDVNDGTYRIPKRGVVWDYVTINAHTHTMSILRMGNNETIYGTMRDAFYIKY